MLHQAEEWKMISHAPKIKMMKEYGRHLRLDDDAEEKLIGGSLGLQVATANASASPRHCHLDARHRHEK
jgi:hypothetical protein